MGSLSFDKFPKPGILFVSEVNPTPCFSHVYSQLNDVVYERWVYTYTVIPSWVAKEGKRIKNITVLGSPTTAFPAIHSFTTQIGNRNIPWTFSRSGPGVSVLLLAYLRSKYTEKFNSVLLLDSNSDKNDLRAITIALKRAATIHGVPLEHRKYKIIVNFEKSATESNFENHSPEKKYFDSLGLQPTTNVRLVKAAYRELAKQYHPDSTGNNITSEKMRQLNEAYEYLMKKYNLK